MMASILAPRLCTALVHSAGAPHVPPLSIRAAVKMSLFSAVEMAPRDPILGLNEAFNADTRTNKVNLGVGVYCNKEGRIPPLRAVIEAEPIRAAQHASRGYLPIDGIA